MHCSEFKIRRSVWAVGLAVVCVAGRARGQNNWIGGAGDWFDPANWSDGVPSLTNLNGTDLIPPGLGPAELFSGTAVIGDLAVWGSLDVSGGTLVDTPLAHVRDPGGLATPPILPKGVFEVGSYPALTATVIQTGGIVYPDNYTGSGYEAYGLTRGLMVMDGGSYDLEAGTIIANAENLRGGTFLQNGGINNIPGVPAPATQVTPSGGLYVAFQSAYTFNGGTLTANGEFIGGNYGTSSFVQSGGINTVTGVNAPLTSNTGLVIGTSSGAAGIYSLSGGILSANSEEIGYNGGSGAFMQTGGTNIAANLYLAGTLCTYTVVGGNLIVSGNVNIEAAQNTLTIQGGTAFVGSVNNSGTVAISASTGLNTHCNLTITGNYTQTFTASLTINLAGEPATGEFGILSITGNAELDGTLNVESLNGFVPAIGDTYTFLTADNVAGTFADVSSPYPLQLNYTATGLSVTVLPEPTAVAVFAAAGLLLRRRR